MYLNFSMDRLPYCCGAYEIGNLNITQNADRYASNSVQIDDQLGTQLLSKSDGRAVFVNFVRVYDDDSGSFDDEFECQEALDQFLKYKGCIDLGTWINPGSGNEIHGLVIKEV